VSASRERFIGDLFFLFMGRRARGALRLNAPVPRFSGAGRNGT
jgi:hypothetical protein